MTKNAKMTWPGEIGYETYEPTGPNLAKAKKRMDRICATPDEVEMYGYDPNGARNNLRPGIPGEDYAEPMDDSRD